MEDVPALRLSVCFGRDLAVELPNGQRDFVGDSVCHAVAPVSFAMITRFWWTRPFCAGYIMTL